MKLFSIFSFVSFEIIVNCQLNCSQCRRSNGQRRSKLATKIVEIPHEWVNYENVTIRNSKLKLFRSSNVKFRPSCLDLSSNILSKWPSFVNSNHLEYLNLSSNLLSTWFSYDKTLTDQNFVGIKTLDLSYNKILKFDYVVLKSLKNLRTIFFRQNSSDKYSNSVACLQFLRYLPRLKFFVTNENLYRKLTTNVSKLDKINFKILLDSDPTLVDMRFECVQKENLCAEKRSMTDVHVNGSCFACDLCFRSGRDDSQAPTNGWSVNVSLRSMTEPIGVACGISLILLMIISIVCLKTATKMFRRGQSLFQTWTSVDRHGESVGTKSTHECMRSNNRLCSFVTHHKFCQSVVGNADSPLISKARRIYLPPPLSFVSLSNFGTLDESEV